MQSARERKDGMLEYWNDGEIGRQKKTEDREQTTDDTRQRTARAAARRDREFVSY